MKILVAEDDLDWGVSIHRSLSREKYIVDWVQDGLTAWNHLDSQYPQYTLAILGWMLPGLTGLELCKRLRSQQNSLPLLILTDKERWEDGVLGLDAGADDYLSKPFRQEELLARLRALRRRSPQFQPLKLQVNSLILDCNNRMISRQFDTGESPTIQLSKKEFQLLEYLIKHPKLAVTHDQLLSYLYEIDEERTSNVIPAQIRRLRRKLLVLGYENVIQTVPGGGYRLNPSYTA